MQYAVDKAQQLAWEWAHAPRWKGIIREYSPEDVIRLSGSMAIEHTLAKQGSVLLWELLQRQEPVFALGALTGMQAVQMVRAGFKAIYCSGWQVAADANEAGEMYPDFSLYPSNSMPLLVKRINASLRRADAIDFAESKRAFHYFVPIIADGEAGFGGVLNVFELTKWLIEAGVAGIHFEDQHPSTKKCGHMRGKVLLSIKEAIGKLKAARLAADLSGVPTLIIARTDADGASFLSALEEDQRDRQFIERRTEEGLYAIKGGVDLAIARALAYAPYADIIWYESSKPDLSKASRFAQALHRAFPGKLLAYNCSSSFYWKEEMKEEQLRNFQKELFSLGYKLQVISLAGFHALCYGSFELAHACAEQGLLAYAEFQDKEKRAATQGFSAFNHQQEVGAAYFERVYETIMGRKER
ncbi:isocitrate lyase [Candidatus Methylacidiphilum infernorum]|uniref:Isocitrate lyase n=1 Tax=Candidatus Methylacidiphilum infernorum TaxID=511746 RepID=A0ABX7PUH9_9BACT|nr:isocitrate lyase [Candidatus Methylacidiphilum infernorum]QSR86647.1 isocitrate lyase [Candidatus Methylacidiphilum infernorum]